MARMLFQCPNCGLGDGELGHLMDEDDVYCISVWRNLAGRSAGRRGGSLCPLPNWFGCRLRLIGSPSQPFLLARLLSSGQGE